MNPSSLLGDAESGPAARTGRCLLLVAVAAAVVALVTVVTVVAPRRVRVPGDGSADAGFARDMAVHHAQAVEMAELIRTRTDNHDVRVLAVDISLTQQAQIGWMYGWLDAWGLPVGGRQPAMAWMGMPADGLMPGMAARAQINELAGLSGAQADARFLRLMIPHHQAGVAMAQAALDHAGRPEVRRLAEAMVAAQQSEIAAMGDLLAAIPGAPAPAAGGHGGPMEHPKGGR
ncbi:MAG: DUF305 domain-containing protein [Egibacteraceae bacterium]